MTFPHFHPPPSPAPTEPTLDTFKAAQRAGATHLSADGRRIYCTRYGGVFRAEWGGDDFGSWWACEGLPNDAIGIS